MKAGTNAFYNTKPSVRKFTLKLGGQGDNGEGLPHAEALLPGDQYIGEYIDDILMNIL